MSKSTVAKKNPVILVQRGDGLFEDVGKGISKAFKWLKKEKPLTKFDGFLESTGLDSVLESVPVVGKTARRGVKLGKKAGIGKKGAGVRGGAKRKGGNRGVRGGSVIIA